MTGTELVTRRFWKEVQWLEDHPRHATSLLLMTNPYWASNFDAFEQFGDALTQALQSATESKVEGLGFEGQIQLVFFHPQYVSVWKSTSASGAPDNSSLSHFSAMTRPCRLRRAVTNRHRHAIEQASRRWRGGRRDGSARTRRKILISTQFSTAAANAGSVRRGPGASDGSQPSGRAA